MRRAISLLIALLTIAILFATLGIWQLERRAWKMDLIEKVAARSHAVPVAAPGPDVWPTISSDHDAYRRVVVHGIFLNDQETYIHASTTEGYGYWIVTPLRSDAGFTVLVNRGFVPADHRDVATRAAGQIKGETQVTGLLRITEPKGMLLQSNDPANENWYSRDVSAIADRRGVSNSAPYFIDADDTPNAGGLPIGGLTVIAFPNNHLLYAATWFGLALLSLGFIIFNRAYFFGQSSMMD